jgi:hypothetical protein
MERLDASARQVTLKNIAGHAGRRRVGTNPRRSETNATHGNVFANEGGKPKGGWLSTADETTGEK